VPGEPDKYYPNGKRTYVRIVPNDVVQGAALATLARRDGCRSIEVWKTKSTYSTGLAHNLETAARALGVKVARNRRIEPTAANYRGFAREVTADCFVFTGDIEENAIQAIRDVGFARPRVHLYGGNGLALPDVADPHRGLPPQLAARFKTVTATGNPASVPAAGKRFLAEYERTYGERNPDPWAIYGYEAMSLLLDSIRRAGARANERAAVVDALLSTRNRRSVLGTYSIDENGDTTRTDFGVLGIAAGMLRFEADARA
jgi:branched-chain amino acid transport system substrate-binding protein